MTVTDQQTIREMILAWDRQEEAAGRMLVDYLEERELPMPWHWDDTEKPWRHYLFFDGFDRSSKDYIASVELTARGLEWIIYRIGIAGWESSPLLLDKGFIETDDIASFIGQAKDEAEHALIQHLRTH